MDHFLAGVGRSNCPCTRSGLGSPVSPTAQCEPFHLIEPKQALVVQAQVLTPPQHVQPLVVLERPVLGGHLGPTSQPRTGLPSRPALGTGTWLASVEATARCRSRSVKNVCVRDTRVEFLVPDVDESLDASPDRPS